jgi:hypothetical protein
MRSQDRSDPEYPERKRHVDNDRFFMFYALTLIAGVTSCITACVMTGIASLPSLGMFVEHLALSVAFRGAYKSFGGFDWLYSAGRSFGFITPAEVAPDLEALGAGI